MGLKNRSSDLFSCVSTYILSYDTYTQTSIPFILKMSGIVINNKEKSQLKCICGGCVVNGLAFWCNHHLIHIEISLFKQ